ncbi:hypothetical protein [Cryptosporangium sp. NPDC051539]|uniref:hypothetical protein n=1 Tax=Cryptosporangium sp. NPDC051539 TaxID=3363962 RepID=UPI0037AD8378
MADETIQGRLDVEHPGAATPFTVLTVNTETFSTIANVLQSNFIVAKDIQAAPPNGVTVFSVRGDGRIGARSLAIENPGGASHFDLVELNAGTFGTVQNSQQSHFFAARDIGAAPPAGKLMFSVRGDGLVSSAAGFQFPDGSVQRTAQAQGPRGPQGPQGPQGPAGALPPTVLVFTDTTGGGQVRTLAADGHPLTAMGPNSAAPRAGIVAVTDQANVIKGALGVDPSGSSFVAADVKNFRLEHPADADVDIVYACVEGPEAAAYVRGTADLVGGRATVRLPEHFTHVVAEAGLTVQVTPWSADSRGLAVTSRSPAELTVEEIGGGSGSYRFDWTVVGVRAGHADYQVLRPRSERPAFPA